MTGYKKLIKDCIPKTWDIGLRWCRAKGKWIDHVYDTNIRQYNNDTTHSLKEKNKIKARKIKDICKPYASFRDSIYFDTFLYKDKHNEYVFWSNVSEWVNWFVNHYLYISSSVLIVIDTNPEMSKEDIVKYIDDKYSLKNISLSRFIVQETILNIKDELIKSRYT